MAVKSAAVASLVAVVRLFYVRVVSHDEHVVVTRALVMSCVNRGRVLHSCANFWHSLLLQICCISLVSQSLSDSFRSSSIESPRFFVISRKETLTRQSHEEFAVSCLSSAS